MGVTGMFHTSGGIAAVNRNTLLALCEEGYQIDLVSLIEEDASIDGRYADPAQVKVHVSRGSKAAFARKMWQAVLRIKYDLILIDHINLAAALAPLSAMRGLRYAVWLFAAELNPPRPDIEGKLGLRYAWKRLAISPYTKDCLHAQFPQLDASICELALDPIQHNSKLQWSKQPVWVTNPRLYALDGSEQILGPQLILHVGRIPARGRDKGQKALLRAFPQILEKNPEAQLALIGGGNGIEALLHTARLLPASTHARVFIPGHVNEYLLQQLYQACYLFAMPSLGEGFGLVYLEAMNRKKPCLGARDAATPYVIQDGTSGLLVEEPQSQREVVSKINWFLGHPSEARAMGTAGFELVQKHYLFPYFKERFFKALAN